MATADSTVSLKVHAEPLTEKVPGARLTRMDGVGHMPQHVAPDQVITAIHSAASRAGLRR